MTPIPIIQEDREAAAKLYEQFPCLSTSRNEARKTAAFITAGGGDGWNTVQAFARHRQVSTEYLVEALEALLSDACPDVSDTAICVGDKASLRLIRARTALNRARGS
jgi:hypothetical protein